MQVLSLLSLSFALLRISGLVTDGLVHLGLHLEALLGHHVIEDRVSLALPGEGYGGDSLLYLQMYIYIYIYTTIMGNVVCVSVSMGVM